MGRIDYISETSNKILCGLLGKEVKIKVKTGNEWLYDNSSKEFTINGSILDKVSDMYIFSKMVSAVAGEMFFTSYSEDCLYRNIKDPENLFFDFLNTITVHWTEGRMRYEYPGTADIFRYAFLVDDLALEQNSEISLPKHIQFLHTLSYLEYDIDIGHLDESVQDEVKKFVGKVKPLFRVENVDGMLDEAINIGLWDSYISLYEKPKNDENDGKKDGGGEMGLSDYIESAIDGANQDEGGAVSQKQKEKMDEIKEIEQNGSVFKNGDESGKNDGTADQKLEKFSYEAMYNEVKQYIPTLKKYITSVMKDNKTDRLGGEYRTGKLNTNRLYKVSLGSDKVFQKKIKKLHKDYKILLLVDISGSMRHFKKSYYASLCSILLAESLDGTGVDFGIVGYNGKVVEYKNFRDSYQSKKTNLECIIGDSEDLSGRTEPQYNNDGYAVNYGVHSLNSDSSIDTEKILFVISDGEPAPSENRLTKKESNRTGKLFYNSFTLRQEVEMAEKNTKVIGIGVCTNTIADHYNNFVNINDPKFLPELIFKQLKKVIHRG